MINIEEIKVNDNYGVGFVYITFTTSSIYEPIENYKFDLYRAMNQNELFTLIATDIKDFRYKDTDVVLTNLSVNYYYKISVTELATGQTSWSEIGQYISSKSDKWSGAIYEIEKRYLANIIETKVWLLQQKHEGQRCMCYNPNRKAAGDDNCSLCFGTTYLGGYYTPVQIPFNYYNNGATGRIFTPSEDADSVQPCQGWTLNFPRVENGDIIVDGDMRFIVTNHSRTNKGQFELRQILTLEYLPKTNIAYTIEITEP